MSNPFVGQIIPVGFNFAPVGWATCDGQLLPISQNTALFSLLGTMYGGDGRTTFGLPDLRGRVAIGMGQGPGLSNYVQGQAAGEASVTLVDSQNPIHTHTPVSITAGRGFSPVSNPVGNLLADGVSDYAPASSSLNAKLAAVGTAGGGQPHNNMMPYLVVTWIIALQGVFPPRQ
jgi:microcystin-dependent protein